MYSHSHSTVLYEKSERAYHSNTSKSPVFIMFGGDWGKSERRGIHRKGRIRKAEFRTAGKAHTYFKSEYSCKDYVSVNK